MPLNYSFVAKNVLITGGGQGIGRQLVQQFRDKGANVFTIDKNAETIQKLREELPTVRAEVIDLLNWDETRQIVEGFGPIDHLVNNAGVAELQKFMDITKQSANLHFDVNVGAAVNVTQTVARGLIKLDREGSVVNICSIGGRVANNIGGAMYSASKAALENLTKSMALELGAHKIRVNCVLPGVVDSPMAKVQQPGQKDLIAHFQKKIAERLIIKKAIPPSEIGNLVMFLLSPLSSMIVGESVVIDGGWLTV